MDSDGMEVLPVEVENEEAEVPEEAEQGGESADELYTEPEVSEESSTSEEAEEEAEEDTEVSIEADSETMELAAVPDSGTCGDNLTWTLDSNGTLTIRGTGAMTNYGNDSCAPWDNPDYYNNWIIAVVIGSGVTSIGDRAFYNCHELKSVVIPSSVTSIGMFAFWYCSALTSVTIPERVTSIGASAFYGCSALTSVSIPTSITNIEERTFWGCRGLKSLVIPESVTSIGISAFYGCSGLTNAGPIGSGCDYQFGWTKAIPDYAFQECSGLTSVVFPENVTSIGKNAFWGCEELKSIVFPESVTNIGESAFYGCSRLTSVTIPSSTKSIGFFAFYDCNALADVYYTGTESQWKAISIGSYNDPLTNATIHYNSSGNPGPDITDPDAPKITALYPANGSNFDHTSASGDKQFHITFDHEVTNAGGNRPSLDFSVGTLQVHKASNDSVIYEVTESSFTAGTSTNVSLWGSSAPFTAISINGITPKLDYDMEYYVTIPAGFVKLKDGVVSPAIEKGDWKFTTGKQKDEEPTPTPGSYAFDWNENKTPINSLSDNLVITMTALAKLGYSTFSKEDLNQSVSTFVVAEKYSELFDKDNPTDDIWEINGVLLGSYRKFYQDVIGNYTVYDFEDDNKGSGFYAVCFTSPDGKYVISYRGSEGGMLAGIWHLVDSNSGSSSDWSTDLDFALRNTLSEQFQLAFDFYKKIENAVGADNIVLTGHSLGGALAGYVSLCTGARAYTIDGAVGHILDTTFWEPFWTVYSFTGANDLNLVNLTDDLGANVSLPFVDNLLDVADAIQATKLNKYPMVTYESLHPKDSTQVKGAFASLAGSHHPLSFLTYNKDTGMFVLGKSTGVYDCNTQWQNDIMDYVPIIKTLISSSNLSSKLKDIFSDFVFNRGRVQLGTTENDTLKAPAIIGLDSFVNNRQFGGTGKDQLIGYASSDVLVSKGHDCILDGQGGSDIYFIDEECRYAVIDDPSGNDTIILRNWDFDNIYIQQDQNGLIRISDLQRFINVNANRSFFSRNSKIEVLWVDDTCSHSGIVCSDLFKEAGRNRNGIQGFSLEASTPEQSATRLVIVEGIADLLIYDSNKTLISDNCFSNKNGDSTVYTEYAYYYGYNNASDEKPYAVLYLFNDGYTVEASGDGTISAALYQYDDSENELVDGSYVESVKLPATKTLAIVSDGIDEGFYLVEGDDGIKIEEVNSFVYAESISLSQTTASLKPGASLGLSVYATPSEAVINGNWYSSDKNIATVDENGVVTAHTLGSAEITFVSINGKSASCNITVTSTGSSSGSGPSTVPVTGVTLDRSSISIIRGNSAILSATVSPSNASNKNVTWMSSDEHIATVNQNGVVTGINVGMATITVITADGHFTVTCNVTVTASEGSGHSSSGSGSSGSTSSALGNKKTSSGTGSTIVTIPSTLSGIFSDVPSNHTFAAAIAWARDNDIMGGYSDGTFRPNNITNRQQMWMVLARMSGTYPANMAKARTWAINSSISDGTNPESPLSRQQLIAMLYRFAQMQGIELTGTADLSGYPDSGFVADYAKEAMAWAVGNGIIIGTTDGRLNPEAPATRAQFAAILYRFYSGIADAK